MKNLTLTLLFFAAIFSVAGQTKPNAPGKPLPKPAIENPRVTAFLKTLKPQEIPELLLLGLYYGGDDSATMVKEFPNGYRTLLLRYEKGTAQLVENLPYLATPQPDRFYFIGEKSEAFTAFDKETFAETQSFDGTITNFDDAYPVIKPTAKTLLQELNKPGIPSDAIPDCEDCEPQGMDLFESTQTSLTYLIPGFATVNYWGDNYTGGAHGNRFNQNNTVHFSTLVDSTAKPIALPLNFSAAKWDTIKRTLYFKGIANLFIDGGFEEKRLKTPFKLSNYAKQKIGKTEGDYQIDPENRDYLLYHAQGVVQLAIRAHASADYVSSGDYELTTEYEAGPLQIPGLKNTLPFRFSELKKADPTISDCFLSPKQNILIVTRISPVPNQPYENQQEITALEVKTGKVLFRKTLRADIIMAEWALGKHADRWQQELKP